MNYYISDLHFRHNNIIRFDSRPFNNIEEMEEQLISNWNNKVTNADTVYILGDFCWGKQPQWLDVLKRLNGKKVLIKGNHDLKQYSSAIKMHLSDIKEYKEIKDGERTVIMCHYPIMCYKKDYDPNVFMLHGHTHITFEQKLVDEWTLQLKNILRTNPNTVYNQANIINVGCMMPWMDYAPRTLDEILERMR